MKVLVTGGAGFIGSHLCHALVGRGHEVRVLDRLVRQVHREGAPQHLPPGVEVLIGDVADAVLVHRALDGVEAVFHQAAEVGVGQSMYEIDRYTRANSLGTAVLLEQLVARRHQVRRLVVASSMSIYGEGAYRCGRCGPVEAVERTGEQVADRRWEPECPHCGEALQAVPTPESKRIEPSSVYAITKQDQEQLCLTVGRAYGVPTVALRYFNVYGPWQELSNPYTGVCAIFSSRLLNGERPVVFEDGLQTRDFVHVSDIVAANLLALDAEGTAWPPMNIGTGVPTTVLDIAGALAAGLGVDVEPEVVGRFREGDIRHCVADIGRARQLLGYEPSVSLAEGMPDLLAWVRQQTADDRTPTATGELESRQLIR